MVKEIPQTLRAQVLWEAGHRTQKSMKRRGGIPERSAERYIAKLRRGESLERESYSTRTKHAQTPQIIRKVIRKVSDTKKGHSLKQLAVYAGVSKETVRSILKNNGFKY